MFFLLGHLLRLKYGKTVRVKLFVKETISNLHRYIEGIYANYFNNYWTIVLKKKIRRN